MVSDPYKVLGISSQATPEEIKSAYRKMAKKYHPDLHPDDKEAAIKMNEVNEAYDMLTHPEKYAKRRAEEEARGTYGNYGGYRNYTGSQGQNTQRSSGGYQGAGGWYSDFGGFDFDDFFGFGRYSNFTRSENINPSIQPNDSSVVRTAINYINSGRYQEAFRTLMQVQHSERNARWYYLNGLTLYGYGDVSQAAEYMAKAVQMEPQNQLYVSLLSQFRQEGQTYYRQNTVVFNPLRSLGKILLFIFLVRMFLSFLSLLLYGGGFFLPM